MTEDTDRYRAVFENAFDAVVVADDDGRYLEVNQSACELFGLEKDELVGRSIDEFAPDEFDFEATWREFREAEGESDTFQLVRADGQRRIVEYAATPNIVPGQHLSIMRDVTEREEQRRRLQETESKYRQLVEQNLVGIYLIQDRRFTYVNPRLAEIFRVTPEDMIGRSPFEWIVPDDHDIVEENLRRRESGEVDSLSFTVRGVRSDGSEFDFQVHGGRVEVDGRPAIIGTLRDVTERRRQEREIREKNERLEEFASILSHDLLNPLNVAQGRLELARSRHDRDELETATNALERVREIIDHLSTLAREGEVVAELEPVDIGDLAEACWDHVDTARAELAVESTAILRADPSRLQELLENLIRNAVQHGGEEVTITIGRTDDGFYVADDGPGIPEAHRDDVFSPGFSTSESGSGWGLSIVHQIAVAHDWTVTVTESTDGGTRFEFGGVEFGD